LDSIDFVFGLDPAASAGARDTLAWFEGLVDVEELPDFETDELRNMIDIAEVLHSRVVDGHAANLVVTAPPICHAKHPDC
jgi:hypothetical protein